MSKTIIIFYFLLMSVVLTAQHEGIERHFKSYTNDLYPTPDYSFYSDTTTDDFFNYLPQHKFTQHFFGYENPGTPYLPMIFSERHRGHKFFFLNNYYPYIHHHKKMLYFDAQKPFTVFNFTGGARELEMVRFFHTQNVNQNLNFGLDIDIINSEGHYMNNDAKVNAITLFSAYTKKRYQSHFNFIYNTIDHYENGGIASDSVYEFSDIRAQNLSTNLGSAQKNISQLGFQYNHEYRLGNFIVDTIKQDSDTFLNYNYNGRMSFVQDFKLDRYYHIYSDNPSDFYENIYLDSTNTFDSTALLHFEHSLYFTLKLINDTVSQRNLSLFAGVRNKLFNYSFMGTEKLFQFHYLSGRVLFENPKNTFVSNLDYCFAGAGMFDMKLTADHAYKISDKLSLISQFEYDFSSPDRVLWYYKSNHFKWDNNLDKTMNISGRTELDILNRYRIGANINFLNNYIIFDNNALPKQINGSNFITDIFASGALSFGNFNWNSKITYQYVSNRTDMPLPELLLYSSFYYKTNLFNDAAVFQTGISGRYHSSSYAYSYMPATGSYYIQNNKKTGGHYMISYHVVVQVKRLRGFVRLSNFNDMIFGRGNYLMYKMPENPFAVNFGISWEFYD